MYFSSGNLFWVFDWSLFFVVLYGLSLIFKYWQVIEGLLRYKLAAVIATELDTDVSLQKLKLCSRGIVLEGLTVGVQSDDSPYKVRVGKIEFITGKKGFLGLASLAGVINLGSVVIPLLIGFKTRNLDSVDLHDVVAAFVDTDDHLMNTGRDSSHLEDIRTSKRLQQKEQKKRRKNNLLMPKFLATKKKLNEQDKRRAKAKLEKDRRVAQTVAERWQVDFTQNDIDTYIKGQRQHYIFISDWCINRFAIHRIDFYLYDHCLHLNHWQSNPKFPLHGSTHQIQATLALGLMNDMIGPAAVVKSIKSQVTQQAQQVHRDLYRFKASVSLDPKNWRSKFHDFMRKHPEKKLDYKERRRLHQSLLIAGVLSDDDPLPSTTTELRTPTTLTDLPLPEEVSLTSLPVPAPSSSSAA